ncbi:DUF6207 family protein [Streptomyces glaucescens]|nr:DUF6207 family protein [Streptomyces glaucescens]
MLAGRWATASADRAMRVPGEPGVATHSVA